jgi:hypothetical protein
MMENGGKQGEIEQWCAYAKSLQPLRFTVITMYAHRARLKQ